MRGRFFPTLILVLGVVSTLGCPATSSDGSETIDTPAQQFTLKGIKIEERRSGKVIWQGVGTEAQGDFEQSAITNLEMTRPPQKAGDLPITISSPSAHLALGQGSADFSDAVISDTTGRTLKAGDAHYSEKKSSIEALGPMSFNATGLTVEGTTSVVQLTTGEITINGPIRGLFTPLPPSQP